MQYKNEANATYYESKNNKLFHKNVPDNLSNCLVKKLGNSLSYEYQSKFRKVRSQIDPIRNRIRDDLIKNLQCKLLNHRGH